MSTTKLPESGVTDPGAAGAGHGAAAPGPGAARPPEPAGRDALRELRAKPGSNRIYLEVGAIYGVILTCLLVLAQLDYAGIGAGKILGVLALGCVIGWCQFSLLNGQHEGLHYNFGARHNEWFTAWFTAYPIGFTMDYRQHHLKHHQLFGKPEDPDYEAYAHFPADRWAFLGRLVKNATGLAAVVQFFSLQRAGGGRGNTEDGNAFPWELAKLGAAQLLILGGFVLAFGRAHPLWGAAAYVAFWIVPLVAIGKLCSSTRTFCEHASPGGQPVFRTITGTFWQTNTLGMFKFNYHAQHHKNPTVPYVHLPALQRGEEEGGRVGKYAYELYEGGYLGLLVDWFRALPWKAPGRP